MVINVNEFITTEIKGELVELRVMVNNNDSDNKSGNTYITRYLTKTEFNKVVDNLVLIRDSIG